MTDLTPEALDATDDPFIALSSAQAERFERLCARLSVGKASEQDAIIAIRDLCKDNERLAVLARKRAALRAERAAMQVRIAALEAQLATARADTIRRAARAGAEAAETVLLRNEPDASPLRRQACRQSIANPIIALLDAHPTPHANYEDEIADHAARMLADDHRFDAPDETRAIARRTLAMLDADPAAQPTPPSDDPRPGAETWADTHLRMVGQAPSADPVLTWEMVAPAMTFPAGWRERHGGMNLAAQRLWADGFNACREQVAALAGEDKA